MRTGWAFKLFIGTCWLAACASDGETAGGAGAPAAGTASGTGGMGGSGGDPAADSWTMMGGDSRNTYFNRAETKLSPRNAAMLKEKWRFSVTGWPPGSPLIAEGKVFVMATGGTYAIDLQTGTMIWARTDLQGTASMAYHDGAVFVHDNSADVYKLNASDGSNIWGPTRSNMQVGCDGTSSPIVANGKVVVGHSCGVLEVTAGYTAARGGVAAIDEQSGMKLWTYYTVPESGENGAMVWSSVAIDTQTSTVFASTGNNYSVAGPSSDAIHAIDLMTGTKRWVKQVRENDIWSLQGNPRGDDTDFGANPILAEVDGKPVVAAGDKGSVFWMLDRETGDILWSRDKLSASHSQANGGVLMNGAFDGKFFYALANDPAASKSVLLKLDPTKMGADGWAPKTFDKITWGAPALANGLLVAPINDDLLVLNAETAEVLAQFATGGTIAAGAPAIANGVIVVGSGMQYVFGGNTALNNNQVICYGL